MTKIVDKNILIKLHAKNSIKKLEREKNQNIPIKYVGLVRVSTDKQEQHGQSVETQIDLINRYCQQRNYDLSEIKQFAESASKQERKQFQSFLNMLAKDTKNKTAIIVTRVDRLTRRECSVLDDLRQQDKIEIHTIADNKKLTSKSSPDELVMWEFNVSMAKRETRVLSNRVKEVRTKQMADGQYPRAALVGYKNDVDKLDKKTIIKDPNKAHLVKQVLEEFAKGNLTLQSACDYTKKIGLTTRNGANFTKGNMSSMLHQPFYCGYFIDNDEVYQHKYDTLISVETFEKIQDLLHKRDKKAIPVKMNKARVFTFSNIIKCKCGCQMTTYEKRKPNGKTYRYLLCSHASTTTPCNVKQVNEDVFLDQLENEILSKLSFDPEILKIYKPAIRQAIQREKSQSNILLSKLQKEKEQLDTELKGYIKSVSQGLIDKDDFDKMKQDVKERADRIEEQIACASLAQENVEIMLNRIIKLLKSGIKLFESSKVVQKNQILKILLLNCVYDGCKLQFSLKKPFDIFIPNGLVIPGRAICAIHEPMKSKIYCNLAKKSNYF